MRRLAFYNTRVARALAFCAFALALRRRACVALRCVASLLLRCCVCVGFAALLFARRVRLRRYVGVALRASGVVRASSLRVAFVGGVCVACVVVRQVPMFTVCVVARVRLALDRRFGAAGLAGGRLFLALIGGVAACKDLRALAFGCQMSGGLILAGGRRWRCFTASVRRLLAV